MPTPFDAVGPASDAGVDKPPDTEDTDRRTVDTGSCRDTRRYAVRAAVVAALAGFGFAFYLGSPDPVLDPTVGAACDEAADRICAPGNAAHETPGCYDDARVLEKPWPCSPWRPADGWRAPDGSTPAPIPAADLSPAPTTGPQPLAPSVPSDPADPADPADPSGAPAAGGPGEHGGHPPRLDHHRWADHHHHRMW